MPAKVPNPRKGFQFNIILPGLNAFMAQEVKLPDDEFEAVEHGDTGHDIKTAGKRKVGMLTVNRIFDAAGLDVYFTTWANDIRSFTTGGGQPPSQYKRTAIVEEYANDGVTVIERHTCLGVWPQKRNGKEFSRKSSDNTVQSLEFCLDEIQ